MRISPYIQRRSLVAMLLLLAVFALAACGAAEPPAGRLTLVDETGDLEREQVLDAAAPLVERGAAVAIFLVERGDENGADFSRRLEAANLQRDGAIVPEGLALYVSFEPRYSELRAGERWSGALPDERLRAIRTEALNPALQAGALREGVNTTLARIEAELAVPGWQRALTGIGWVLLLGIVIVGAIALANHPAVYHGMTWLGQTPPGRLANWLWALTPIARRRQRARAAEEVRWARYDMEAAAREVESPLESTRRQVSLTPLLGQFETAYSRLIERRDQLHGRAADAELARALRLLGGDMRRLAVPLKAYARLAKHLTAARVAVAATSGAPWAEPLPASLAQLEARLATLEAGRVDDEGLAEQAGRLGDEFEALQQRASALAAVVEYAARARKRFEQALAGGKFGKRNARKQQAYTQQLAALDERRDALLARPEQVDGAAARRLVADYEAIDRAVWQILDPREYAAAMRHAAAVSWVAGTSDSSSAATTSSDTSSTTPADYGSFDGGSSGPSSDGGSW